MGTNFVLCILGRELFSWVRMWVGVFLGSGERERCLVLSEKKKMWGLGNVLCVEEEGCFFNV